jgi:hypothetical protein
MAQRKQPNINTNKSPSELEGYNLGVFGTWMHKPLFQSSRFYAEWLTRLVNDRDMNIVITASSETGVGKTTLAVTLSLMMDPHGWTADKASVADPQHYNYRYDEVPAGSCLVLDEAEKAMDARRGMSDDAVTLSQTFATKRYRQVFSILTAPSKNWIDKRLGNDAADFWLQAQQTELGEVKGEATCYRLKTNEHYETDYSKRTETIEWPDISWHQAFDRLNERKESLLESGSEQQYVDADAVDDMKQESAKQARKNQRQEIMQRLDEHPDMTQRNIAEIFDLALGTTNDIINENT